MTGAMTLTLPPLPDGAVSWNAYVTHTNRDYSIFVNLFDKSVTASHEGKMFDIGRPEDRERFDRRLLEHRSVLTANRLLNRAECEL